MDAGQPERAQATGGDEGRPIDRLLALMAALRDPVRGCAWDLAQTPASIVPYTLEEAYEVADAVARGDTADLRDELGDLLLQVVFQARMAEEAGAFVFDDVAAAIADKLVRRHPHVFDADGRVLAAADRPTDPAAIEAIWAAIKARERAAKVEAGPAGAGDAASDPLGGIAAALPALARADKISRRAAATGFDWPDAGAVVAKVREELAEVEEVLGGPEAALAEELGDLLFSVANLARHAGIDPEAALRAGNAKFERRFRAMTDRLAADGPGLAGSDLAAMEAAWDAVKRAERSGGTQGAALHPRKA